MKLKTWSGSHVEFRQWPLVLLGWSRWLPRCAKNVWRHFSFRHCTWWTRPLAFVFAVFCVFTCIIGAHQFEHFAKKGRRCIWCDKPDLDG